VVRKSHTGEALRWGDSEKGKISIRTLGSLPSATRAQRSPSVRITCSLAHPLGRQTSRIYMSFAEYPWELPRIFTDSLFVGLMAWCAWYAPGALGLAQQRLGAAQEHVSLLRHLGGTGADPHRLECLGRPSERFKGLLEAG